MITWLLPTLNTTFDPPAPGTAPTLPATDSHVDGCFGWQRRCCCVWLWLMTMTACASSPPSSAPMKRNLPPLQRSLSPTRTSTSMIKVQDILPSDDDQTESGHPVYDGPWCSWLSWHGRTRGYLEGNLLDQRRVISQEDRDQPIEPQVQDASYKEVMHHNILFWRQEASCGQNWHIVKAMKWQQKKLAWEFDDNSRVEVESGDGNLGSMTPLWTPSLTTIDWQTPGTPASLISRQWNNLIFRHDYYLISTISN